MTLHMDFEAHTKKKDEVEDLPPRSEVEFIVSLTDIQIKNWGI